MSFKCSPQPIYGRPNRACEAATGNSSKYSPVMKGTCTIGLLIGRKRSVPLAYVFLEFAAENFVYHQYCVEYLILTEPEIPELAHRNLHQTFF